MHVAEDAGDNDVIAALDEIAFATLNRSNEIPAFVRTYLAKKAAGHIRPRGGSSAATNYLRDICIMVVLLQLVETFGPALKFTRAPYERRSRPRSIPRAPSACSIARQALFEADVFVGDEAALNKIVLRFKSSGRLHREGSVWKLHSAIKLRSVRKVPSQHLSNH